MELCHQRTHKQQCLQNRTLCLPMANRQSEANRQTLARKKIRPRNRPRTLLCHIPIPKQNIYRGQLPRHHQKTPTRNRNQILQILTRTIPQPKPTLCRRLQLPGNPYRLQPTKKNGLPIRLYQPKNNPAFKMHRTRLPRLTL